jgi:hypothetical protein
MTNAFTTTTFDVPGCANEVTAGVTEVLCCGTAVVMEPVA